MIVVVVVIVLVLVALAWFFLAGEQQVGHSRFGEPRGAASIIELGILQVRLGMTASAGQVRLCLAASGGTSRDTSCMML
jgi:hypothetical protein